MLDISIYRNSKLIWEFEFNREQRRAIEKAAGQILKDASLTFLFCLLIAGICYFSGIAISSLIYPQAIPCANLDKIDVFGNQILSIIRRIGRYVCLVMCTKDIIGSVTSGSYKDIVGIIIKYATAYAGFYVLPAIFDLIQATFA